MRGAGAASAVELLKEDLAALKDSLMSTEMDLVAQVCVQTYDYCRDC